MLTWYECTFLNTGDRVRFIEDYEYSPRCVVPEGTPATVIRNRYKVEPDVQFSRLHPEINSVFDPGGELEVLPVAGRWA